MNLNLRDKFLVPTTAAVAVAFAAYLIITTGMAGRSLNETVIAEMEQIDAIVLQQVETWFADREAETARWAELPELTGGFGDPQTAAMALRRLAARTNDYEGLHLVDARGLAVASTDAAAAGQLDVGGRQYFQQCRQTGETAVSDPIASKVSGNPIVVLCQPVGDGALVGVLDLAQFTAKVTDPVRIGETGYVYITDEKGTFLAHPSRDLILKSGIGDYDWGRAMVQQKRGFAEYEFKGRTKKAAFRPAERLGWIVAVTIDDEQIYAAAHHIRNLGLLLTLAAVVAVGAVIFLVARSVTRPVNLMIDELNAGAEHTAAAATQISNSSVSLAEQASEQAAAVEETSASLEEMTAGVRETTQNTESCQSLMGEAKAIVERGLLEMEQMNEAIGTIKSSADETAKIVKTIDEIAFQTNLLALNAAVEAARAGEAGKGFAVVAEEVRNLAQRAAEAARDTAELIAGSVQHADSGVAVAGRTREAFLATAESAGKVAQLVDEIAGAAREQSTGIDQINKAVGQMDKVTQSSAANAEESASAAEELSAQAAQLRSVVASLRALIAGRGAADRVAAGRPQIAGPRLRECAGGDDAQWHALADSAARDEVIPL